MEENNKLLENEIKDNILLVNINRSFNKAKIDDSDKIDSEILYWATKEAWRVDPNKVKNINYVCPVYNKKIVGTFVLNEGTNWYLVEEKKSNNVIKRYGFNGKPVENSVYNDKDVSDFIYPRWAVRYILK